jgi:hypothetical protein
MTAFSNKIQRKESRTIYPKNHQYILKYITSIILISIMFITFCNIVDSPNIKNGSQYLWVDNSINEDLEIVFTPRIHGIFDNYDCQTEIYKINASEINEIKLEKYLFRQPMVGYYDQVLTFRIKFEPNRRSQFHLNVKINGKEQIVRNDLSGIIKNDLFEIEMKWILHEDKQGWYFHIKPIIKQIPVCIPSRNTHIW